MPLVTLRRLAAGALLISLGATSSTAAPWAPVKGRLETAWTKDVSAEHAWPEYPRPQMVRRDWVNLNGLWQYAIRPKGDMQPDKWEGEILVPFAVESALSGVQRDVQPDERLWYRRSFAKPKLAEKGRLLLHFGAVDWQCTVWINGKEVGQHQGGYDPFTFDVTEALRDGENEAVVAVWDPTDEGPQPRGKQVLKPKGIWYTAVTGIWQTAWLEPVPENYIKGFGIVPDIDRGLATVIVEAAGGQKVRIAAVDGGHEISSIEGAPGKPLELKIKEPKLWSPESPHLYDVKVSLIKGDKAVDEVQSYLGMRKIAVGKDAAGVNRLMLNNKPVFQYGPLDQGWWPDGLYTAPTDAALRYDVEMTKKLGMNMARKHVKVEPDRWYYWCDKLGLLVWQDMPSGRPEDEASKADFRQELQAMVDALRNHPSIVMWVPFNEGWGQHDTPEIAAWTKKLDPSRPVNESSGWDDKGSGDVSDMHNYPGPGMRPVEDHRVGVLGEFGGLGMPVKGHSWQDEKNWGYVTYKTPAELTDAYVRLLAGMRPLIAEGLSAAVYTQTTDVEIEVNGLLTYDRAVVKMDQERIAAAARQLYGPPPTVRTLVATSNVEPQSWKYTMTKPDDRWTEPAFDDSAWKEGGGGFGKAGTRRAVIGTAWESPDIWLRRKFKLDAVPPDGQLFLNIFHDDDAEVYLNGRVIAKLPGLVKNYNLMPLDDQALQALLSGENTLAIHCHQADGGQNIDAGLILVTAKDQSAASKPAAK